MGEDVTCSKTVPKTELVMIAGGDLTHQGAPTGLSGQGRIVYAERMQCAATSPQRVTFGRMAYGYPPCNEVTYMCEC